MELLQWKVASTADKSYLHLSTGFERESLARMMFPAGATWRSATPTCECKDGIEAQ
jgi:hypothetical protein